MAENPPAFPGGDFTGCEPGYGMTLRDWFAGQALTGLISEQGDATIDEVALDAYRFADAMIAARETSHG